MCKRFLGFLWKQHCYHWDTEEFLTKGCKYGRYRSFYQCCRCDHRREGSQL